MKKKAKKAKDVKSKVSLELEPKGWLKAQLHSFVIACGLQALEQMLEREREALCGVAYARDSETQGRKRAGSTPSRVVLGGRNVRVTRPRVRDAKGEVPLPSWSQLSQQDPLSVRILEQMLVGVSTRKYGRSLDALPEEVTQSSTAKSSVSRQFQSATWMQLQDWLKRPMPEGC